MALEVTNEIQSTASNQTVAQAKYIADDDFMAAHSTTNNKQNTINEWLANHDKTYKLTLNGTTNGDGNNGEDLGTLYAPTSKGTSGQYLKSTGNGAPAWSSLPEYNLGILAGTSVPVNTIQLTKWQDTTNLGTWNVKPKLYYKNNSSDSGIGNSVDIRLYAGDNITFTAINETVAEGEAARSGVKIDANVTTIPKATTASLGGIKLKSSTTISSVNNPISGNAYPIQLTSDGVAGVVFSISTTELVEVLNQLVNEARNDQSLRIQLASFFVGLTNITEQTFKNAMGTAFNTILRWKSL